MSVGDELKNEAEYLAGKVKKKAGELMDEEQLTDEGRREQARAEAREESQRAEQDSKPNSGRTDPRVLPGSGD
jgi:uncharacterized protein YjbJ (UPF0337 family)